MLRKEWQTQFTAESVLQAAKLKVEHHKKRLDHYGAKMDELMQTIKKDGLEIRNVPNRFDNNYIELSTISGRESRDSLVYVRNDLNTELQKLNVKVEQHKAALANYHIWTNFLESASALGQSVPLDFEDYTFFFSEMSVE